jgi:hypothetical protein
MISKSEAKAYPTKRFFLEMFTRDISLEDCILDLIDNSIDAVVRTEHVDLTPLIFNSDFQNEQKPHLVRVDYSTDFFRITDDCGGVSKALALEDMFRFGHVAEVEGMRLGAYGIGLKRALFKIGNTFQIISKTLDSGFEARLDVQLWASSDESPTDWTIPVEDCAPANSPEEAGTTIYITELRDDVKMRIAHKTLDGPLVRMISQVYALFLGRLVNIEVNGERIEAKEIAFGTTTGASMGKVHYAQEDVKVTAIAGIAQRDANIPWRQEAAGWYIACNGRFVVVADKSELTGLGVKLPSFHTKYRGFLGLVLFQSENPLALPWTTTKRSLNRESEVYQLALNRMHALAQPVITYLNELYASDTPDESQRQREVAEKLEALEFQSIAATRDGAFVPPTRSTTRKRKDTVRVQFDAAMADIEKVRKRLRKPSMSAGSIGKFALEHYVRTECPD